MKKVMEVAAKQTVIKLSHAQKALNEGSQRASYILRELTLKGRLTKIPFGILVSQKVLTKIPHLLFYCFLSGNI